MATQYLHSMIRVTDPEATIAFFDLIGVKETRRFDSEAGRFTLIFLAAPGQEGLAEVELTHNWPPEDGEAEVYAGGLPRRGYLRDLSGVAGCRAYHPPPAA
jgi:lactoylglutathione lyase